MPTSRMEIGGDLMKTSWPEVLGMGLSLAAGKIHGDRPDVVLQAYLVGTVPAEPGPGYDPKRVRIFVNKDATYTVAETPVVG